MNEIIDIKKTESSVTFINNDFVNYDFGSVLFIAASAGTTDTLLDSLSNPLTGKTIIAVISGRALPLEIITSGTPLANQIKYDSTNAQIEVAASAPFVVDERLLFIYKSTATNTVNVTELVDLDTAKKHLLVDHSLDDEKITNLITWCRQEFEEMCNISLVDKVIILIANWEIRQNLPYGPVKQILEVKVRTNTVGDNTYDTLTTSDWGLSGDRFFSDRCGEHTITYIAGPVSVGLAVKKSLLNLIAFRYEHNGDHDVEMSEDVIRQLLQFKDYSWA